MLQKKSSKPAGKALAAGLLAAWMSVTPIAYAAGPNEEPANNVSYTEGSQPAVQQLDPVQLLALARNYSLENNAIGVFVNKAPDTDLTGEQIGTMIVQKFQEAGIPAAFIHNIAEAGQSSIDFFVEGTPYAGYALNAAFEGFETVSGIYKALDRKPLNLEVVASNP